MSARLVAPSARTPGPDGRLVSVTPESAGWSYVGFEVYRLGQGMRIELDTAAREVCAVMLVGRADMSFGDHRWTDVGARESVFRGTPDAVYAPPGGLLQVSAASGQCEVALCWAPATAGAAPVLIPAAEIKPFTRGSGRTERTIHNILMEDRAAESLLVTEVLTPGGSWSSYPPHKHDEDRLPDESQLEESYYFRINPPQGFALERVYTSDGRLDQTAAPRNGDLVLVPRGYHVVGAPHGYEVYYLNVLAGPKRALRVTFDPDHVWVKESWDRVW